MHSSLQLIRELKPLQPVTAANLRDIHFIQSFRLADVRAIVGDLVNVERIHGQVVQLRIPVADGELLVTGCANADRVHTACVLLRSP